MWDWNNFWILSLVGFSAGLVSAVVFYHLTFWLIRKL